MIKVTRAEVTSGTGGAERNVSPALRDALNTIREAWTEPRSLLSRCRTVRRPRACEREPPAMERAAAELPPRAGASPGLLRRRYSVPETIMRKYRLAQQRSDSEESAPPTNRSAASASPPRDVSGSPADSPHRFARRDRELMRKSALMRRMWGPGPGPGRACEPGRACCCCGAEPCDPAPCGGRETRSLDGSRSELRQLSSLASSRYSHVAAGWATPKRQRLDSSRDFRGSDEMLRAAMRNSYDRAEDSRNDRTTRADFSDSTYRSHIHEPSSTYLETGTDAFTDSDGSKFDGNAFTQYAERQSSDTTTLEVKSSSADEVHATSDPSAPSALSDERSLSDSSETFSASYPTTKESAAFTRSAHIDGRVCERSASLLRDDNDAVPYDKPLSIHTPSYELLEIVVSETLNVSAAPVVSANALPPDKTTQNLRAPTMCTQNINIDEYVSNILVESLNSLTDQLECMNASMGNDRKISIVEKEIKVKLQNTGVNTIVHLSPTSNNQIIFGNEELCVNEERKDSCNNLRDEHDASVAHDAHDALTIRDEVHSVESNNNLTSAGSPGPCPCGSFDLQHDNVNQAVLQQIQKLFQDELHNLDPAMDYSAQTMPEISHIEISNVTDVFIDNENDPDPGAESRQAHDVEYELISGVGTGSYYHDIEEHPVVPRFSAFPHTDSMEVNTSSSDDADLMGSDCTSLVDSLDDPNSPRSVLLRRACTGRRSELVRSAIDVLELLPENARNEDVVTPKDKGEAFFIKIKDNECDCDKENVNVADRMPEKIKQRLYRRHRKREMRMECARRTRGKQRLRERDRDGERRHDERCRARRDVERECVAIVNALIDDVISRVAQDEYKCMRIKNRPSKMVTSKSDDNVAKRTWKKQLEPIDDRDPLKSYKRNTNQYDSYNSNKQKGERHQIHGKLSFVTRPAVASDDRAAKRIYQKSEIHEGNKCIEILEILEYVNGSQSSPETTTSDENQNHSMKNKKSRIPIPIYEKYHRMPNNESSKNNSKRSSMPAEHNGNTSRLIADMLLGALGEPASPPRAPPAPRRASVPHEPRSRSNSLRFKQVFDIIPEERSSLSLDSGNEDLNHNRRASAPDIADIADQYRESSDAECNDAPAAPAPTPLVSCSTPHRPKSQSDSPRRCRDMKSAGTSPITESDDNKQMLRSKNQTTMTSPSSKSAATSPMRASATDSGARAEAGLVGKRGASRGRSWMGCSRPTARAPHDQGNKERAESDKVRPRRSVLTQYERHQALRARTERGEQSERNERAERPPRLEPRPILLARSPSSERARLPLSEEPSDRSPDDIAHIVGDKRKLQSFSNDKSDEDGHNAPSVKLPEFKGGGDSGAATSSDSSESGSLLCSLAPRWLAQGRARRAARRRDPERPGPAPLAPDSARLTDQQPPGGWSVTVAGSCRAALPADVEMRLRFPHDAPAAHAAARGPCQVRHHTINTPLSLK
ncbi:hypothetical protein PYW08_008965 [Mythimna loreyi]|uniref:Uncharacterized protein n=1 Tax=Mythimna loreyi TaxID=667449 RepID=A0ACC2Q9V0_9NEOP|nr:hypothetical protein PYW08_008965 [Mythimna loreyi]